MCRVHGADDHSTQHTHTPHLTREDNPSILNGVRLFTHEKEDDPKKKEKEKELASKVTSWIKTNKRIYLKVLQYKAPRPIVCELI
jgi:ABC-type lipoprotein release transport system permease subunit